MRIEEGMDLVLIMYIIYSASDAAEVSFDKSRRDRNALLPSLKIYILFLFLFSIFVKF